MIKVAYLILVAFFTDPGDTSPSFHSAVEPFPSLAVCEEHKAAEAEAIIPPNAVMVAVPQCVEVPLYPKDSI